MDDSVQYGIRGGSVAVEERLSRIFPSLFGLKDLSSRYTLGTVVKRLKLYNRLIVNVIENSYLCVGKKNTSNRPRKAEFGGIAKINLHGKGTKFLRNITGSSVHRV